MSQIGFWRIAPRAIIAKVKLSNNYVRRGKAMTINWDEVFEYLPSTRVLLKKTGHIYL
jgi:hypothetical protein